MAGIIDLIDFFFFVFVSSFCYIAVLNQLCNSCRGNPPWLPSLYAGGRHGGTTPTYVQII